MDVVRDLFEFDFLRLTKRNSDLSYLFTSMMNIFEYNPFAIGTGQMLMKMRYKTLKGKLERTIDLEKEEDNRRIIHQGDETLTTDAVISSQLIKEKMKIRAHYDTGIMDPLDNPKY